jgi:RNA polymerase sigma factor (sigma-70 family)
MFETTMWSRIGEAEQGGAAAEAFVGRYRKPLLIYLSRRGLSESDAQDLVQDVFLRLFEKNLLSKADRTRGRFRSYLLGITKNVLYKEQRKRSALKRGGGKGQVSLEQLGDVAAPEPDPEFDACWTQNLIQRALDGLKADNARQYGVLQLHLRGDLSQKQMAETLDRTPAQVKTDLYRARQRLTKLIKAEIAHFASTQSEYDDEVASLLALIGG